LLDFLSFGVFRDQALEFVVYGTLWGDSYPSNLVLNTRESQVPRIGVFRVLVKTIFYSLPPRNSCDPFGFGKNPFVEGFVFNPGIPLQSLRTFGCDLINPSSNSPLVRGLEFCF